jgi:hypothetical protein
MSNPIDFHALPLEERLALTLSSPAPFFVTGEDSIQLSALNSATGVTLTIVGRFKQLNGEVTSFQHFLTPTTDRVLSSIAKDLGDGWIMNFAVFASVGTPLIGQCWARVQIIRGLGGAQMVIGALVSGYVTALQPIAFPAGKLRGALDGPGVIRSITGTNPAAGAEISETVPTGAIWRLLALRASLTTSIDVGNRRTQMILDDGTNEFLRSTQESLAVATVTTGFNWYNAGYEDNTSVTNGVAGFSDRIRLNPGYRIRTNTIGLFPLDDWSAPQLLVEEWIAGF